MKTMIVMMSITFAIAFSPVGEVAHCNLDDGKMKTMIVTMSITFAIAF